jgi:hypothetical protein
MPIIRHVIFCVASGSSFCNRCSSGSWWEDGGLLSELVGDWARLEGWRGRVKKSSESMSDRIEGDSQAGEAMDGVVRGVMNAVSMGGRLEDDDLALGLEGDIHKVGGI